MIWEIDRVDWSRLRAGENSNAIPSAIVALQEASSHTQAKKVRWDIEFNVVVHGRLFEAAVPTIACLLSALQRCTPVARLYILELLVQIGSGEPDLGEVEAGNSRLQELCLQELCQGIAIYFDILENGGSEERDLGVDLLGLCCIENNLLKNRVKWYFNKLLCEGVNDDLGALITNWLEELK